MWNTPTTLMTDRQKKAFLQTAVFKPTVRFLLKAPVFIGALLLLAVSGQTTAQTLQMQIIVEEEFALVKERPIHTGAIQPDQGWIGISLEDEASGHLRIRAEENTFFTVTLDAPEELIMNPENTLPFRLQAAYITDGGTNPAQAVSFDGSTAFFRLSQSGLLVENMDPRFHRLAANILLYGEIYAGDVEPGLYQGEVGVRVEYH